MRPQPPPLSLTWSLGRLTHHEGLRRPAGAVHGAREEGRVNRRNGHRHGDLGTRVGRLDVAVPKLRDGSYFPDWRLTSPRTEWPRSAFSHSAPSFKDYHLRLALTNGLTGDELVEAVTHLNFYSGWPTAVTATNVLEAVLADEETLGRDRGHALTRT